jgi:hypothetical protein
MGEGRAYTLRELREFHEAQAWQLEADEKRRGAWAGERERRAAFEATVRLIDRISNDSVIVERLKAGKGA